MQIPFPNREEYAENRNYSQIAFYQKGQAMSYCHLISADTTIHIHSPAHHNIAVGNYPKLSIFPISPASPLLTRRVMPW